MCFACHYLTGRDPFLTKCKISYVAPSNIDLADSCHINISLSVASQNNTAILSDDVKGSNIYRTWLRDKHKYKVSVCVLN